MKISEITGEVYSYHGYQYPQLLPAWALQAYKMEDGKTLKAIASKAKTQSELRNTLKSYGLYIDPTYKELQDVNRKALAEYDAEHTSDAGYTSIKRQIFTSRLRGQIEAFNPDRTAVKNR